MISRIIQGHAKSAEMPQRPPYERRHIRVLSLAPASKCFGLQRAGHALTDIDAALFRGHHLMASMIPLHRPPMIFFDAPAILYGHLAFRWLLAFTLIFVKNAFSMPQNGLMMNFQRARMSNFEASPIS